MSPHEVERSLRTLMGAMNSLRPRRCNLLSLMVCFIFIYIFYSKIFPVEMQMKVSQYQLTFLKELLILCQKLFLKPVAKILKQVIYKFVQLVLMVTPMLSVQESSKIVKIFLKTFFNFLLLNNQSVLRPWKSVSWKFSHG